MKKSSEFIREKNRDDKCIEKELIFKRIIENNPIPFVIYHKNEGTILFVNKKFITATAMSVSNYQNRNITEFFADISDYKHIAGKINPSFSQIADYELTIKKEDFSRISVLASFEEIIYDEEPAIIMSFYDITERKWLEKQVLEITNREQRLLGQELHDGLGQQLTGITYHCKILEKILCRKNIEEAEEVKKINGMLFQAIEQTRKLASNLLPIELEKKGIISTLADLSENVKNQYNLNCEFHFDKAIIITDNVVALQLYRIAQEAVHNAIKHANADNIVISLSVHDNRIFLKIEDDGIGVSENQVSQGLGLHIMQYRSQMINGWFSISSKKEQGTVVSCSIEY